jgi:hypothetical protein
MNSSLWVLECSQTHEETMTAVDRAGTEDWYNMVSCLSELFCDEMEGQIPAPSESSSFAVPPKVSAECLREKDLAGEEGDWAATRVSALSSAFKLLLHG